MRRDNEERTDASNTLQDGWETYSGQDGRPTVGQDGRPTMGQVGRPTVPLLLDMQPIPEGPSWRIVSFWHLAGFKTNSPQALTLKQLMPVAPALGR